MSYSVLQYVSPFAHKLACAMKAAPPVCLTVTRRPVIQTVSIDKRSRYIKTDIIITTT